MWNKFQDVSLKIDCQFQVPSSKLELQSVESYFETFNQFASLGKCCLIFGCFALLVGVLTNGFRLEALYIFHHCEISACAYGYGYGACTYILDV